MSQNKEEHNDLSSPTGGQVAFSHRGIGDLIPHIEALIFASDKPLAPFEITELINNAFGFMEDKIEAEQIDAALEEIVEKYNSEF